MPKLPLSYVFLDMQMPNMNGIQVLTEIRKIYAATRRTNPKMNLEDPIFVFLTGFASENLKDHLVKLGVKSCHLKPIEREVLVEILSDHYNFFE